MIDTRNISNLVLQRDKKNEERNDINHQVMERLNYFGKRRLTKLNNLIFKLTNTVKTSSSWLYTYPSTFTLLSDFSYDPSTRQITYTINSITADENGYFLREDHTEREEEFFNKYYDLLIRLFELEQRREAIYEEHKDKEYDNVIPFSTITPREALIKENQDKNFVVGFTNYQMDIFIRQYNTEGIRRLIKLLNDLTNSKEPYSVYLKLRNELSGEFIQELLRWAALYTPVAQAILDQIAMERVNRYYEISGFPSYEDRMTDNITKLL